MPSHAISERRRCSDREPVPFGATLFDKSADANWLVVWHQDTALPFIERREVEGWGPWSKKAGVDYAHAPAAALATIVRRIRTSDRATTHPTREW